jgi:PTH1 family peptidyl-tRNA hydrolase
MRTKGSSAGHNGLNNIELLLGGQDIHVCVSELGMDYPKGQQVDFVLSRFTSQEFEALPAHMDKAIEMILLVLYDWAGEDDEFF